MLNTDTEVLLGKMPKIQYAGDQMVTAQIEHCDEDEADDYNGAYVADVEGYDPDDPSIYVEGEGDEHYEVEAGAAGQGEVMEQQAQNMLTDEEMAATAVPGKDDEEQDEVKDQEQDDDDDVQEVGQDQDDDDDDDDDGGQGGVQIEHSVNLTPLTGSNVTRFLEAINKMKDEELNQDLGKIIL